MPLQWTPESGGEGVFGHMGSQPNRIPGSEPVYDEQGNQIGWSDPINGLWGTPMDSGGMLRSDKEKMGKVIKETNKFNKDAAAEEKRRKDAEMANAAYKPQWVPDENLAANQAAWQKSMADAIARQTPTVGLEGDFRTGQLGLMNTLQNRVAGNAPSVAEQQLRAGQDANIKAAMAAAASGRGRMGGGTQYRSLQNAMNDQSLATNQQAGLLRAQEQGAAETLLAQQLSNARGQDIGVQQGNQQAALAQQQIIDNMVRYYTTQGYTAQQAELLAKRAYEQQLSDEAYRYEALKKGIGVQTRGQNLQLLGAAGSGIAKIGSSFIGSDGGGGDAFSGGGSEITGGAMDAGSGMMTA